jgi:hypothetical protein
MSESDQFRQYAEEALLWVAPSKAEEEKQLLLGLVLTWTQAAVASDALANDHLYLPAAISIIPDMRSHAANQ